ncbi:MAG TPA: sugar ABC transporter ATP-binding protein [Candidatus Binataceae bacterium]|nr:sugar ABC transporter ATP-binding protein [Candidatus Binataceae bacterium]
MLDVEHLAKSYGPIKALRDVSLSLAAGEVRAVCGENGAGKSTLMRVLMGVSRPDAGTIRLDGGAVSIDSPQQAQRLGIALVAQELSLAPDLSILDNIWLGNRAVPLFHRRKEFRRRAAEALTLLGVDYGLDTPVSRLTMGQRQIVEIARMLVRDARILILDEPTATLSDVEIERMMSTLRSLRTQGKGVLYVTHRLGEVFEICDSVTVLRNGANVGSAAVGQIDRARLIALMLGRSFTDMYPAAAAEGACDRGLEIRDLHIPGSVARLSLIAPRGRITCIAGQVGAGASAVTRAVAGLVPSATGTVLLDGTPLQLGSLSQRVRRNIAFVSEDRAAEGIFNRSVLENLVASRVTDHASCGFVSWPSLRRFAAQLCAEVTVDRGRLGAQAFDLSGGNQQKLLFARALGGSKPGVILINEPTRGVDVGARAEIYRLLREFCQRGYVLLMTSSDLEEVVGISDTVLTLYRGEIVSTYQHSRIDMTDILADITHPVTTKAA